MTGKTSGPAGRWRPLLHLCALISAFCLPSCASWDGHFELLGYTTRPNYDTRYKTIRVPMCKNRTYWTVTPSPGMEMDLHRAIVREIQLKTPYKIAQDNADTELVCNIVSFVKNPLTYTQFNTIRDVETVMTVELYWRDLHTGEILTRRSRRFGEPLDSEAREPVIVTPDSLLPPGSKPIVTAGPATVPTTGPLPGGSDEDVIDPVTKKRAQPVVLRSVANFRPELGQSLTTSLQSNIDRLAVQIVSVMEKGW
jgi:hypothetical protein